MTIDTRPARPTTPVQLHTMHCECWRCLDADRIDHDDDGACPGLGILIGLVVAACTGTTIGFIIPLLFAHA